MDLLNLIHKLPVGAKLNVIADVDKPTRKGKYLGIAESQGKRGDVWFVGTNPTNQNKDVFAEFINEGPDSRDDDEALPDEDGSAEVVAKAEAALSHIHRTW